MIGSAEDVAISALYEEVARIKGQMPSSRWYLFGSITTTKRPVGDIDLLVVCETPADCALVRAELEAVCSEFPIHLLLMTLREEAEVQFIKGESAVEIS
jgi:hypothetical protein